MATTTLTKSGYQIPNAALARRLADYALQHALSSRGFEDIGTEAVWQQFRARHGIAVDLVLDQLGQLIRHVTVSAATDERTHP